MRGQVEKREVATAYILKNGEGVSRQRYCWLLLTSLSSSTEEERSQMGSLSQKTAKDREQSIRREAVSRDLQWVL